ncbi:hypothetical protein ACFY04_17275 [Streptomyces sp. NPDC001549]|uniref:hypothetical protein n=1 Tax=Streptomyces sp. NPDC001549 TaxID=3364586 RepID=UPI0036D0F198
MYDAALWTTLLRHLQTAHIAAERIERGERVLYPPLREQWVYDSTTKQNPRKGLTPFPNRIRHDRGRIRTVPSPAVR